MLLSYLYAAGADYIDSEVTFLPGETEAIYPVPIVNDNSIESTETFTVSLSTNDSFVNIVDDAAFVTILDEDSKLFTIILSACNE